MKRYLLFLLITISCACNNNSRNDKNIEEHKETADSALDDMVLSSSADNKFIIEASEGSMTEIALGRFASGRATDQRLKSYGYLIIEDHERLLNQLKQMAVQRRLTLPDTTNAIHQKLLAFLEPKGGNIFDSTYMSEVITHQKQLAVLYENAWKTLADTALSRYAARELPLLNHHLLQLVAIKDSIYIRKRKK